MNSESSLSIQEFESKIEYIGPKPIVIIRIPNYKMDNDPEYFNVIEKQLEPLKSQYCFIIIEDSFVEEIRFEYPLNHNNSTHIPILNISKE